MESVCAGSNPCRGFESPPLRQNIEAQDPDKSCASSLQTFAIPDTCAKGTGACADTSPTPSEHSKDAVLRPEIVICLHFLQVDPALQRIVESWGILPEHVKQAVALLVNSSPAAKGWQQWNMGCSRPVISVDIPAPPARGRPGGDGGRGGGAAGGRGVICEGHSIIAARSICQAPITTCRHRRNRFGSRRLFRPTRRKPTVSLK